MFALAAATSRRYRGARRGPTHAGLRPSFGASGRRQTLSRHSAEVLCAQHGGNPIPTAACLSLQGAIAPRSVTHDQGSARSAPGFLNIDWSSGFADSNPSWLGRASPQALGEPVAKKGNCQQDEPRGHEVQYQNQADGTTFRSEPKTVNETEFPRGEGPTAEEEERGNGVQFRRGRLIKRTGVATDMEVGPHQESRCRHHDHQRRN
jgi:hypothetical protein